MVRRLVEQEEVRLRHQRLAEQRPPPPAARELAQRAVRRQRQPRHDGLDLLLEAPAVTLLELVLKLAEPVEAARRFGEMNGGVMILRHQVAKLAEAGGNLVEHGPIGGERHFLVEARDAETGRAPNRSAVGGLFPEATFSRLDLPAPLRPIRQIRSPLSILRLASSNRGR